MRDKIAEARRWLAGVADLLEQKNTAYGNSAFDPLRVFSRADRVEQLRVRIDDKLSRMARGDGRASEDTLRDLAGYLALLAVALAPEAKAAPEPETASAGIKAKPYDVGAREREYLKKWREEADRVGSAMLILEEHRCNCECEHRSTEHNARCRRCLACMIKQALTAPMGEP